MQEILLKVFVVTLGLLTYPTDDPGVEENWDGEDWPMHEPQLLTDGGKVGEETAPVAEEITHSGDTAPLGGVTDEKEQQQLGLKKEGNHTTGERGSVGGITRKEKEDVQTFVKDSKTEQGRGEQPPRAVQEAPPLSGIHTKASQNKTSKKAVAEWGKDFLFYMWNTFSLISLICFLRKHLKNNSQATPDKARPPPLPDSDTLQNFHAKCVQASLKTKWREDGFLEGFANDLLETMRVIGNKSTGMVIEDFTTVDVGNINIPLTPPQPYRFQCQLGNNQASDLPPDMQVCGQIKLLEKKVQNGCPCQSSEADDDMVCLLHGDGDKAHARIINVCEELCSRNAPFLSKSRVTRWFQGTIKQAWKRISHKYDFELSIRYIDAPGTLAVRFRSGKMIRFRMNPVVKFHDAHFYITPCSPRGLDTVWTLSLTGYEERLLQGLSKRLPEDACHIQTLEIARFLYAKQTHLSSAVEDSHFKTALMHLLLMKHPSQWKPSCVSQRLQDLLDFMERSLEKKQLQHVLIGNRVALKYVQLPAEFTHAKPVNLFHPLVVHNCIYRNAAMTFQEMLRNAHMLIQDYVDLCTESVCST